MCAGGYMCVECGCVGLCLCVWGYVGVVGWLYVCICVYVHEGSACMCMCVCVGCMCVGYVYVDLWV